MTTKSARVSLSERAYQSLRADIVSGRLAPGRKLTERELIESTGLGASPIRGALTRLDHEGLVVTRPRKGYLVAPLTAKSIDDILELWSIIAPAIARLGLMRATPGQRKRIQRLWATAACAHRSRENVDETSQRVALVLDAFRAMAACADNRYLMDTLDKVVGELTRTATALFADSDVDALPPAEPLGDDPEAVVSAVTRFLDTARIYAMTSNLVSSAPSARGASLDSDRRRQD